MIKILRAPLVFDVVLYDRLGAVAGDRRDVVAVRPELSSPEFFLDRGDECEYLFRGGAFHESDHLASAVFGKESAEYVQMILVESDLGDLDGVAFFIPCQCCFDYSLDFVAKESLPVLHRQLDVVVALRDVVVPIPDISFLAFSRH